MNLRELEEKIGDLLFERFHEHFQASLLRREDVVSAWTNGLAGAYDRPRVTLYAQSTSPISMTAPKVDMQGVAFAVRKERISLEVRFYGAGTQWAQVTHTFFQQGGLDSLGLGFERTDNIQADSGDVDSVYQERAYMISTFNHTYQEVVGVALPLAHMPKLHIFFQS